MKKLYLLLFLGLILTLTFTACSDSSKKGGATPPETPTAQDVLIFEDIVSISDTSGGLDDKMSDAPVTPLPSTNLGYQLLTASLVDSSPKEQTPAFDVNTNIRYLGTSKSGDLWYYNEIGLFRSNVKQTNSNSECILASQQMALDYLNELGSNGLYKVLQSSIMGEIVEHNDENHNYSMFIQYYVSIDTADNIGEITKRIVLEYNSKDNTFTKLFKDDGYWETMLRFLNDWSTNPLAGITEKPGLLYYAQIKGGTDYFIIRYDPLDKKHYLLLRISSRDLFGTSAAPLSPKCFDNKCYYIDSKSTVVHNLQCTTEINGGNLDETKEKVATCVNDKLENSFLEIKEIEIEEKDITSYLGSSVQTKELLAIAQKTSIKSSIKNSKLKIISKDSSFIHCNPEECFYYLGFVPDGQSPQDSSMLMVRFSSPNNILTKNSFYPSVLQDKKSYQSYKAKLLRVNYMDGTVSTVESPQTRYISNFGAKTINGEDVVFYRKIEYKGGDTQPTTSFHLYNTTSNSSQLLMDNLEITLPTLTFREIVDTNSLYSNIFTHNGNYLLFGATTIDTDEENIYFIDLKSYLADPNSAPKAKPAYTNSDGEVFPVLIWKGKAFWSTPDISKYYFNEPFTEKTDLNLFSDHQISIRGGVTINDTPAPELPGFNISESVGDQLRCGGEAKQALWCRGDKMCINKVCKSYSFPDCSIHTDCDSLMKEVCLNNFCTAIGCSDDSVCPIGTYCTEPPEAYCAILSNMDECKVNEQCVGDLKCLLDEDKGYSICKLEEAVAECSDTEACPENLICTSIGKCLPKMPEITTIWFDGGPIITPAGYKYPLDMEWTPPSDKDGNPITNYKVRVIYNAPQDIEEEIFEDVTDGKINFKLFIDGAQAERNATVKIWPHVEGLTEAEISELAQTKVAPTLENDDHCKIVPDGTGKCPNILYNCTAKEDGTGFFCKYNSSILDWSLQNQQLQVKPDWLDNNYQIPHISPPQIPTPPIPNENEVPDDMEYQMNRFQQYKQDPRISPIPLKRNIEETQIKRIKPGEPTD